MTNAELNDHDERRFDRLVDGELPRDEYRALLSSLDDEPGAWRACALAFLEAQAVRGELSALRGEQAAAAQASTISLKSTARPRTSSWIALSAMAASFLMALALGFATGKHWMNPSDGAQAAGGSEEIVAPRTDQRPPDESAVAVQAPRGPQPIDDAGGAQVEQPMGNVTLLVDGKGDDPQRVEVPIYYPDQLGSDFLASDHTALSPEIAEWLRRSGHRVQRAQSYFPMQLDDGQQVVVPVEEIQITPVSLPPL